MRLCVTEDDPRTERLRTRLDEFYNNSASRYTAFEGVSQQNKYWDIIVSRINELIEHNPKRRLDILEFGSGRTGFPTYLGSLRLNVNFTAQDVTNRNIDHLSSQADVVHIGDLRSIIPVAKYDIIFSTFVWEHISDPKATIDALLDSLKPQGSLFLFSPRYDFFGYVPPAVRHLSRLSGLLLSARLQLRRIVTMLGGAPSFLIVPDPALFHCDRWFSDADAVHLASLHDINRYIGKRATIRNCWPAGEGIRQTILERFTKLCVEIRSL